MENLNLIKPERVQNIINKFCYTIGMIPTSYKISLTYEEQILAIGHYLETTVYPAINNNAEALAELQNAFIDLKNYVDHYFDDLDIQAEIEAKLDEMLENGELEEIVEQFLSKNNIIAFNNIEEMKSATNLIENCVCKTLGFYNINDKGGALYRIRKITGQDVIDNIILFPVLDETLVAELIINNSMNVKQFGAKGDGETDDTINIQKCIDNVNVVIIPNGTFMIKAHNEDYLTGDYPHGHEEYDAGLILPNNITIKGLKGSVLKVIPNNAENYCVLRAYNKNNITIDNLTIIGDKDEHLIETGEWGHGIMLLHVQNVTIKNCNISKTWGDGIYLGILYENTLTSQNTNINIINNILDDTSRNGIALCSGKNVVIHNNKFYNITRTAPKTALDIEPEGNGTTMPVLENIDILDFTSENCGYSMLLYYTRVCEGNVVINMKNLYSKNDRVSYVFNVQENVTKTDKGEINIENVYTENSGYTAFSIVNWLDTLPRFTVKNIKILNSNDVYHNTDGSVDARKNGSGFVVFHERNGVVNNITIENLDIQDTRTTKYINKGYYCYGLASGKITLKNPINLYGVNRNTFTFTNVIDENNNLIENVNYNEAIVDLVNVFSLYLTSGYSSDRTIRLYKTDTQNLSDGLEIEVINDNTHSIKFDLGSTNRNRIYPFANTNRYLKSTDAGATMKIKKINGQWFAIAYSGTWTNSST